MMIKDRVYCKERNARPIQQLVTPLLSIEIRDGDYQFLSVGVDYFEHSMPKQDRSIEKHYSCVLICLRLRALHLGVIQIFTTDSLIMALMRSVSGGGYLREVHSDDGPNLIETEHQL